jgi:hypothetical protein
MSKQCVLHIIAEFTYFFNLPYAIDLSLEYAVQGLGCFEINPLSIAIQHLPIDIANVANELLPDAMLWIPVFKIRLAVMSPK